jgi:tRNA (guanine37-N1)-methyltransferase
LREQHLPYKYLIGQVLLDKNVNITTVINKTFDVGTESVYRTFPYEVLAGPDQMEVTVRESDCEFKFDFSKVYWNSRLGTEHARLFETFKRGEAVCDVTAGVGPFAVPAGKRKVFVRANDLNPDSYAALQLAIKHNKVGDFVTAACCDGREFIRKATIDLAKYQRRVQLIPKFHVSRSRPPKEAKELRELAKRDAEVLHEPRVFSHYIMNLPATGIEFLDAFLGLYRRREAEFHPITAQKLPLIHLYLFQAVLETESDEAREICQRISKHIGTEVNSDDPELDFSIRYVRLVSPKKRMYCATFRIPRSVAFA